MTALVAPKGLIFDWDNTLIDSWVCIQESYNRTFRHFGMPEWSMDETMARVAASMRDSFPAMFGERWEEARDVFYRSFEDIHLSHLRPLPGAGDMLARLGDMGARLAVVSNKKGDFLRKEAEVLGWGPLFDALVGAGDAEADKPSPAPVALALAEMGLRPGPHVWFVGDAAIDMHCAANTGCTGVLMRPHPPTDGEFASYPFSRHMLNCPELASLVAELGVPISPE